MAASPPDPGPPPLVRRRGGRPAALTRPRTPETRPAELRVNRGAVVAEGASRTGGAALGLTRLMEEWLLELRVSGRSPRTLGWYRQHVDWFLRDSGAVKLDELTASALKQHLAAQQERGLAENTVHGSFQCVRGLASWLEREGYPVDPAILRLRAPKVSQREMESYTAEQLEAIFRATPAGWPTLAGQLLLGTGMRISELCALRLTDVEDDGEAVTLKVQRGKGAKFRRVPISSRLRRELARFLNRVRPDGRSDHLLLRADGEQVSVGAVMDTLGR